MLHHYTTVNTLALILRHQTIRFTRLDQFDDVTEGRSIGRYPAGARMFASCWSAADEESIPQWAMYGDAMRGVRISLRPNPFRWSTINLRLSDEFFVDRIEAPFSVEEMLGPNITLLPMTEMRRSFGQSVKYVDDVPSAIQGLATAGEDGTVTLHGQGHEIAFFKSKKWAFQREFRYVLVAAPGPVEGFTGDVEAYKAARRVWQRGIDFCSAVPSGLHVDLRLDPAALVDAEIVVGPLAQAGTLEIVEALVARFSPGARVRQSSLSGTIRPR